MKHEELIKKMSLSEKASLCSGLDYWHTPAVESAGLPQILWTDGPHGIRKRVEAGEQKSISVPGLKGVPAICFPTACTTACSWDPDLMYEMGQLLGEECLKERVSVLLGPGINMKRSPLCGRNFEYFSEDPFLAGNMAAAFINGVQSKGVGTSLKHYAVNSQETRRMTVNAVVDERALREIYLTGFEIAVKQAQPWTVMCMYNRLNGTYGAENKWLLTDMLRNEFGFKGMVVTDWGAENERVPGLLAGQNLEMPTSNGEGNRQIENAVISGEVDESVLDESVDGVVDVILKAKEKLDRVYSYDATAHHKKAREIASQCMVLMKNEDGILPLDKDSKIALIGQMAKKPRYQGAGSSLVNSMAVDSAWRIFTEKGIDFIYADGYPLTRKEKRGNAENYIKEAVKAAEKAETALLFIGLTDEFESEGFDRTHLRIPPEHVALVNAVSTVNKNTVVVLAGGAVIEMPWENQVKAILNSYLSGEGTGGAVYDILFGDVNPSGKLAETYPYALADTPSYKNFPGNTATVEYRESIFIGYRYYDTAKKEVRYPFGHGLSYTTFEYSSLVISKREMDDTDTLTAAFKIKNTGERDGAEIAQLYVSQPSSTAFRPEKELKAFKKVFLKAGEEAWIEFPLSKRAFAFFDTDIHDWRVETSGYVIMVGASSRDIRLTAAVKIKSTCETPVRDRREELLNYYKADVQDVPERQFVHLLGYELPEKDVADYPCLTLANTLEDSACGKNGAKICALLRAIVGTEGMACSIALQTPIKNFVSMSMGVFGPEAAEKLLNVLNDNEPLTAGFMKLMAKEIPALVKGLPQLMKSI
ncbi:MAG: glycoside hydrolase family 3 C-terminal domain-containing protein [Clostridia bacterium]|nr:glycoside hydrolase family 3 C-terminal domain-containing protein [Clostridia bacterium]